MQKNIGKMLKKKWRGYGELASRELKRRSKSEKMSANKSKKKIRFIGIYIGDYA